MRKSIFDTGNSSHLSNETKEDLNERKKKYKPIIPQYLNMKRITVIITTYNRRQMLTSLLNQIKDQCRGLECRVNVRVYDDGSDKLLNYPIQTLPFSLHIYRSDHRGKGGYWETINKIYQNLPESDYYIQLPDDVTLADGFFEKAVGHWDLIKKISTEEENPICLSLLTDKRTESPNWTGVQPATWTGINGVITSGYPQIKSDAIPGYNYEYILTGWNDLCFISGPQFFESLRMEDGNYIKPENPPAHLGSGVGRQISQRLHKMGYGMYHVAETLVYHSDHPSVMHPELRKKTPLISKK